MNREMKIEMIKMLDTFYSHTDFSGHDEIQLNIVLAKVVEGVFKDRNLTWDILEENKFKVESVAWNNKMQAFTINGRYCFTADEIEELSFKKTTETKRAVWHFVK